MSYQSKFIFPEHGDDPVLKQLVTKLEIEFKSIQGSSVSQNQISVISVGAGGGGIIPAGKSGLFVSQSVTSGTVTVSFTDVGTASFGVYAFTLKSTGDVGLAVPQVPPLTDTRTSSSVQIAVYDTATLMTFIILP